MVLTVLTVQNFEWPLGPRLLATELQLKWLRGGRTVRVLNTHLVYVCREGESEEEKAAFKEQVDVSLRVRACVRACVCARARVSCGCAWVCEGVRACERAYVFCVRAYVCVCVRGHARVHARGHAYSPSVRASCGYRWWQ